ncbi:hypothetical protein ACF0H5_010979 [Mactra antiquata]
MYKPVEHWPFPTKNAMKSTREGIPNNDRFKIFESRADMIHHNCAKLRTNISKHHTVSWIKTDPVHQIYYCFIPKIGSTFWKRVLTVLPSNGTLQSPYDILLMQAEKHTSNISPMVLSKMLRKGGQSFMFVRDPYTRLFSAYVNKVYDPNPIFWKYLNDRIVARIRNKSSTRMTLTYSHNVTFPEFIKYILYQNRNGKKLDIHYRPMHTFCDPCRTHYTYIGHLETFVDDATYILSKWRQEFDDVTLQFDNLPLEAAVDTARSRVKGLFEAKEILQESQFPFIKLILRTWRDLQIRGYISKKTEFPFKGDVTNVSSDDVMEAIIHALDENHNKINLKMQRQEALIQAYHQVPLKDMELLREYLLLDCLIFGYDDQPSILFDRSRPVDNAFLYLDGLSAK